MIDTKRINELYKKEKTVGLTEEEKKEQEKLRNEYRKAFRQNLINTLNNIEIKDK